MVEKILGVILLGSFLSSCSFQAFDSQQEEALSGKEKGREMHSGSFEDRVNSKKKFWRSSEKHVIVNKSFFDPESVSGDSRKIDSACRGLLYAAIDAVRKEEYLKAQANIERAIRIQPSDPYLWTQLAFISSKRGDFSQAFVFAKKAAAMVGNNVALSSEIAKFIRGLSLGASK